MFAHLVSVIRGFFQSFSVVIMAGLAGLVLAGFIFLFSLWQGLPDVSQLKDFQHANSTEVYSADGTKIGEYTVERRYSVPFESIPRHVVLAFVAAEDSNFYEHGGIDFVGILRALVSNVMQGRYAQGASTITQQVARSILLATRKKEITRKIREMILARRMEKQLSKNEIMSLYLSEIYLGHGAFGIAAAARNYFQKKVQDLDVAEAAILAGLPQRPAEWDPFRNPFQAKQRQRYVLKRMVEEGYLTAADANEAFAKPLKLYPLEKLYRHAPYFTEYVRTHLMKKYGDENVLRAGYRVYTTVRHDFQQAAEKAVHAGLREVDKRLGWRGPIQRIMDPAERVKFTEKIHEDVLDNASLARILSPTVEAGTRGLAYDLSEFQSPTGPYFGATPVKPGEYYQALVRQVNDIEKVAFADVGQTRVRIFQSSMEWVLVEEKPLKLISQILKEGDVVQVKIESVDRTSGTVIASLEQEPEVQAALLSYEIATGSVVAMVGGTGFAKSQFNRALQAKRQVGSTFKPLVYAAALDKGFSPSSIVTDSPVVFRAEEADMNDVKEINLEQADWKPSNYSGKFQGEVTLRTALIRSMNVPTVKLLHEIGIDYCIQYARALGITSPFPRDLTIGLGSWSTSLEELMRAYAIFPRLGRPGSLVYITKVLGPQGDVLEEYTLRGNEVVDLEAPATVPLDPNRSPPGDGKVISPQTAYVMTDMLKAVVREGTGGRANISPFVAGKTGTSNDFNDAWFIGYSPHVMTGVWVGYDSQKPLSAGESGGRAAAPIWAEFMKYVLDKYPKQDFPIPDDVVFAYVDRDTGYLATSAASGNRVRVAFTEGQVPDSGGMNVARVPEPGVKRATTQAPGATPDGVTGRPTEPPPADNEDFSDLLREGY